MTLTRKEYKALSEASKHAPAAAQTYAYLSLFEQGIAVASRPSFADAANVSENDFKEALKALEEEHLVTVKQFGDYFVVLVNAKSVPDTSKENSPRIYETKAFAAETDGKIILTAEIPQMPAEHTENKKSCIPDETTGVYETDPADFFDGWEV